MTTPNIGRGRLKVNLTPTSNPGWVLRDHSWRILLAALRISCIFSRPIELIRKRVGAWLSPVERLLREQEAGGSNPLAPTKLSTVYSEAVYGICVKR